jgi:hypothetical protein
MGFGGRHGHAGFGQDVLAGREGADRDGAMQVRPGTDDDRIHVRIGDQVLPLVKRPGNAELPSRSGCRLGPTVADRHDFDAANGLEARDVPEAGVTPGADQTDA